MTDAASTISVKLFAGLEPGAAGLVLVNGVHAGPDHVLGPGDEVALFPPLGGG